MSPLRTRVLVAVGAVVVAALLAVVTVRLIAPPQQPPGRQAAPAAAASASSPTPSSPTPSSPTPSSPTPSSPTPSSPTPSSQTPVSTSPPTTSPAGTTPGSPGASSLAAVATPGSSGTTIPGPRAPGLPAPTIAADPETIAAGWAFLGQYVDGDGRVVRRDQGGDTVSEGQAYAMLVAVALRDGDRFAALWRWTQDHLRRPDGLLSWRWQDGAVADVESAADADLDAARALVLAGAAFGVEQYTTDGIALGRAVLAHETVTTTDGRILVAGTWARQAPYAYNPSYASPAATRVLAAVDPDPRWAELDRGTTALTTAILDAHPLPPDWGRVDTDGRFTPTAGAAGAGGEGVRYAWDAARLPIRFAEACRLVDVTLAGRLVGPLRGDPTGAAIRDLTGAPLTGELSTVAAAAEVSAFAAIGDADTARARLTSLTPVHDARPGYYQAAWNALGRFVLRTDLLGGCPALPG